MPKYGLATLLEDQPIGYQFSSDNWPLHITHIDTFEIDMSLSSLCEKLELTLANKGKIHTKALSDEMFGPQKDILVTRIELTKELQQLHHEIVFILEKSGAKFKRPFIIGENYNPHVTVIGNKRIDIGEELVIRELSIVEKDVDGNSSMRRIAHTIELM